MLILTLILILILMLILGLILILILTLNFKIYKQSEPAFQPKQSNLSALFPVLHVSLSAILKASISVPDVKLQLYGGHLLLLWHSLGTEIDQLHAMLSFIDSPHDNPCHGHWSPSFFFNSCCPSWRLKVWMLLIWNGKK